MGESPTWFSCDEFLREHDWGLEEGFVFQVKPTSNLQKSHLGQQRAMTMMTTWMVRRMAKRDTNCSNILFFNDLIPEKPRKG